MRPFSCFPYPLPSIFLIHPVHFLPPSHPAKPPKQESSIPSSELLKRLLVVGVVGVNVASKAASRNGESGALLHEERSRGRAGERRSGARASCATDQGGDGHCVWVVCGSGDGGGGGGSWIELLALLWSALLRCCERAALGFPGWILAEHVPDLGASDGEGLDGNVGRCLL
jgi:hypothetical protein